MTDQPPPRCCACEGPAIVRYRMVPYRVDAPLCECVRQALMWPGVSKPCDVFACVNANHQREVMAVGNVQACNSVDDAAPVERKVGEA